MEDHDLVCAPNGVPDFGRRWWVDDLESFVSLTTEVSNYFSLGGSSRLIEHDWFLLGRCSKRMMMVCS